MLVTVAAGILGYTSVTLPYPPLLVPL